MRPSLLGPGPVLDFYFSGPHPVRPKPVLLHGSLNRIEVRPYEGAENIDAYSFNMTENIYDALKFLQFSALSQARLRVF